MVDLTLKCPKCDEEVNLSISDWTIGFLTFPQVATEVTVRFTHDCGGVVDVKPDMLSTRDSLADARQVSFEK